MRKSAQPNIPVFPCLNHDVHERMFCIHTEESGPARKKVAIVGAGTSGRPVNWVLWDTQFNICLTLCILGMSVAFAFEIVMNARPLAGWRHLWTSTWTNMVSPIIRYVFDCFGLKSLEVGTQVNFGRDMVFGAMYFPARSLTSWVYPLAWSTYSDRSPHVQA